MKSSGHNSKHTAPYQFDPARGICTVRGATTLPEAIFQIADEIQILDASFGHLRTLPSSFGNLRNLRIAFFSHNDFEAVPEILSACANLQMVAFKSCKLDTLRIASLPANLRGLILTDNRIGELPDDIGSLRLLQKLMLTGNRLQDLPRSLLDCNRLELMRVSLNQLEQSPDWLFELPSLAWYCDSANSFQRHERHATDATPQIRWSDLQVHELLGSSAKNEVYAAQLAGRDVAVKLFGEGVTTDGSPMDDMNAALLAGNHANIIGGIGRIVDNPSGQEGFVMPRIPSEYSQLGLPPDFNTLTRDVFPDQTVFSEAIVRRILRDVAAALSHLAGRGIMHGDVYAHNILSDPSGNSYLGDFGAASLFEPGSKAGLLRERVEVRGFGYLADDLLARCASSVPADLASLRDTCLSPNPALRPTFAELMPLLS